MLHFNASLKQPCNPLSLKAAHPLEALGNNIVLLIRSKINGDSGSLKANTYAKEYSLILKVVGFFGFF